MYIYIFRTTKMTHMFSDVSNGFTPWTGDFHNRPFFYINPNGMTFLEWQPNYVDPKTLARVSELAKKKFLAFIFLISMAMI